LFLIVASEPPFDSQCCWHCEKVAGKSEIRKQASTLVPS